MTRCTLPPRATPACTGLVVLLAPLIGCGPTSFLITPVSASPRLVEHEVLRESLWASRKIALLDVNGLLRNSRRSSLLGEEGDNPVSVLHDKLTIAAEDDAVRAVVLRINSPGGGVTASDLMHQEVRRFRERSGKPVVAVLMDIAASGGYYVACAADRIIAQPTCVTGSIGVVMIAPDLSGLMQKVGVRANVVKSGAMKDAGSPFREMGEADRALFQAMIDDMYERFVSVVQKGRPGVDPGKVRRLADGRVYTASQALEHGLVDAVGTLHDALDAARDAAGLAGRKIVAVEYARPHEYRPNVYAEAPVRTPLFNVDLPFWLTDPSPQFLYLWLGR